MGRHSPKPRCIIHFVKHIPVAKLALQPALILRKVWSIQHKQRIERIVFHRHKRPVDLFKLPLHRLRLRVKNAEAVRLNLIKLRYAFRGRAGIGA